MNFEPFSPFERSETLPPPAPVAEAGQTPSAPPAHYFDRAGCVWIVACVLLAGTAGRMLPSLAEPGGVRHALVALGLGSAPEDTAKATTVAGLPPHSANPVEATRDGPAKQEIGPLVPAILRQF
nr:hypothetical protein [uncultured Albidiferax sp.]